MLFSEEQLQQIGFIASAFEAELGARPTRTDVCRMAIAALYRRLGCDGKLPVPILSGSSAEAE